jgi:hypothetical protein
MDFFLISQSNAIYGDATVADHNTLARNSFCETILLSLVIFIAITDFSLRQALV